MLFHKHDWHEVNSQTHSEDKPHGTFIRTIYYHIEECSKCGQQRKAIYNDWVHKPEEATKQNGRWAVAHECVMWGGHREYEPLNSSKETGQVATSTHAKTGELRFESATRRPINKLQKSKGES